MKKAVILFNLGGPDSLDAVEPFLFNLFNDKNIITIPNPMRFLLGKLISSKRAPIAKEIYKQIGNKSPIVEETQKQAKALEELLNCKSSEKSVTYKTFISMRYWHPFSYEVVEMVKEYNPDEVILLPLYPQFSTTTSKSSMDDWFKFSKKLGLNKPTRKICSYHTEENFIEAHAEKLRKYYDAEIKNGKTRVLFSAHGLPERIIKKGDPYQRHVEETVAAVLDKISIKDIDYSICYQSRVGRLKWIGPSTDDEIRRSGKEGISVIIVPIAFVSEHSETLVELDIEYKHLAEESGVKNYVRVPTLGVDEKFIKTLANVAANTEEFVCNCYYGYR